MSNRYFDYFDKVQINKRFDFDAFDYVDVPDELKASIAVGCARRLHKRLMLANIVDVEDLVQEAITCAFNTELDDAYSVGQKIVYLRRAVYMALSKALRVEFKRNQSLKTFGALIIRDREPADRDYSQYSPFIKRALNEMHVRKHALIVKSVLRGCKLTDVRDDFGVSISCIALIMTQFKAAVLRSFVNADRLYYDRFCNALRRFTTLPCTFKAYLDDGLTFSQLYDRVSGVYKLSKTSAAYYALSTLRGIYHELEEV